MEVGIEITVVIPDKLYSAEAQRIAGILQYEEDALHVIAEESLNKNARIAELEAQVAQMEKDKKVVALSLQMYKTFAEKFAAAVDEAK